MRQIVAGEPRQFAALVSCLFRVTFEKLMKLRGSFAEAFVFLLPVSVAINATVLGLILTFATAARADDSRLHRLYHSFMAPCCWTKNVAEHDSQAAQDVRARIDAMVQAGRTDDEIKTALVGAYGRRILALPDGEQGTWLFVTPLAAVAAAAGMLWWLLARLKHRAPPAHAGVAPAELDEGWDFE